MFYVNHGGIKMIKSISMLGNTEATTQVATPAAPKTEAPKTDLAPAQDTFVPSAPKAEEAPKADPNDKFVKTEEKPAETK